MTRPSQKAVERQIVERILATIALNAEVDDADEKPDIIVRVPGHPTVGVEVTMYASRRTVSKGRFTQRQIESAWENFETASTSFRSASLLRDKAITFCFKDTLPAKREYIGFFEEIKAFVVENQTEITAKFAVYSFPFTSPLMARYLSGIAIALHENGEWDSNKTSGVIESPAETIAKIISDKSVKVKSYRKTGELWLAIGTSGRPSETVLPVSEIEEFISNAEISKSLIASPFTQIYVFTAMGLFSWHRAGGWQIIGPRDLL